LKQTLDFTEQNTLFYFDPPYKPLSETSSFNSYTKDEFNDSEQVRLKDFCSKLDVLNHTWILSNSDVKGKDQNDNFFDNLYSDFNIQRVEAKRSINANPEKIYLGVPFGRAFRSNLFVHSSQKGFPLQSLTQPAA
jgi:DNA adenine methylase